MFIATNQKTVTLRFRRVDKPAFVNLTPSIPQIPEGSSRLRLCSRTSTLGSVATPCGSRSATNPRAISILMSGSSPGGSGESPNRKNLGAIFALGLFLVSSILPLVGAIRGGSSALQPQEISQRLDKIPVFSVTDSEGKPFLTDYAESSGSTVREGLFYLDPAEAEQQLVLIKKQGYEDARVLPVSLKEALNFVEHPIVDKATKKADEFRIQPKQLEIDAASTLLGRQFSDGVPLFYMDGLAINRNNDQIYPVFFNYEELEKFVSKLKDDPKNKEFLEKQTVNIIGLNAVLREMRAAPSGNSAIRQMILYPPEEGIQYLKSHQ
uniref:Uncharacterized protein n=1 Tax=Timspurckia oligopyrenoides TaxID=708627 RepID=A0A7S1EUH9_9RHOD|mmetsp:Transcript_8808/g.15878  ORF Transcript_8808/g.15878 Transcript_8808/m.15878 type:complete len:323 (+) Transcript_8808:78-1046(+)